MLRISAVQATKIAQELEREGVEWKHTSAALTYIAEKVAQQWKIAAANPKQSHAKWFGAQYAKSISVTERKLSQLKVVVGPVGEGAKMARIVEEGRERFDMKPGLLGGKRARQGKNGKYTIVAFKHGIKEVREAESVSGPAPVMSKSGSKTELNAKGQVVRRNYYTQSSKGLRQRVGNSANRSARAGRMDGVLKVRQKVGKAQDRAQEHGVSFRVVSVNSPQDSWMFPKIAPENIRAQVIASMNQEVVSMLRDAIAKDIGAMGGSR